MSLGDVDLHVNRLQLHVCPPYDIGPYLQDTGLVSLGNRPGSVDQVGDQSYFSVYVTLLTSICCTRKEFCTSILPYGVIDTT